MHLIDAVAFDSPTCSVQIDLALQSLALAMRCVACKAEADLKFWTADHLSYKLTTLLLTVSRASSLGNLDG